MQFRLHLSPDLRCDIRKFLHMPLLELLKGLECHLLVLPHIDVPIRTELLKLLLLNLLHAIQLFNMRDLQKVALANTLLFLDLLDFDLALLGLLVIAFLLAFLSVFVQKLQESKQPFITSQLALCEYLLLIHKLVVEL